MGWRNLSVAFVLVGCTVAEPLQVESAPAIFVEKTPSEYSTERDQVLQALAKSEYIGQSCLKRDLDDALDLVLFLRQQQPSSETLLALSHLEKCRWIYRSIARHRLENEGDEKRLALTIFINENDPNYLASSKFNTLYLEEINTGFFPVPNYCLAPYTDLFDVVKVKSRNSTQWKTCSYGGNWSLHIDVSLAPFRDPWDREIVSAPES